MLRQAKIIKAVRGHEETFLAHYRPLLKWALHLTDGDREQAEDLVHDAFIQFTFSRPDLAGIQNLDGYLYSLLRNLHLSQLRRRQRLPGLSLTALQYNSAELSLRAVDPRDQIRVQDELWQICRYACIRKETSKAGCVLLLRFMLGYYPREIAQVMRGSRGAVEERLRLARNEAKLFLENPGGLHFIRRSDELSFARTGYARSTDELLNALRSAIFGSCRGDCLPVSRLKELYGAGGEPLEVVTLGHIVSCPRCLDAVNRLLGLPTLSERYPTDTLGTDPRPKGGGGGGTPASADEQAARRCRRRARETFEHRPQELCISVNGYVMASQKIRAPLNEQALSVNAVERINFVEVFSEQEVRLLFLCVDELPPEGPHRRSVKIELSDERTLEAALSFSNPWPTVQIVYHDPLLVAADAMQPQPAEEVIAPDTPAQTVAVTGTSEAAAAQAKAWQRLPSALADALRSLIRPGFWLQPGTLTAALSLVLIAALLFVRLHEPTVSAAELLNRSTVAEQAIAGDPGTVLQRTISLEARRAGGGKLFERRRIEVWQSAARATKVRRLYDERGTLLAAEWEEAGGAGMVYQRGSAARKGMAESAPALLLSADDIWRVDLSSAEFDALAGRAPSVTVEERAYTYVLNYAGQADGVTPQRLIRATLTLSKGALRAIEQTLVIEDAGGEREYHFAEAAFTRQPAASIDPSIFRPEPELLSKSEAGGESVKATAPTAGAPRRPLDGAAPAEAVASAELEIEINYLLNQIKANLGEQVSVERIAGGQLRVEARVETERRKEEILRALSPVLNHPAIVADVSTIEEAVRRRKAVARRGEEVQEVEVTTERIPADTDLRRYFSARLAGGGHIDEEIERFARREMNLSRQALMHASALNRLAGRFSPAEARALAPEARAKWAAMLREHARSYREYTSALRRELRPIFSPGGDTESATQAVGDENLRQSVERLLRLSYAHDEAVRSAFTLSEAGRASVSLKSPQFWRSLAAAESLAAAIEAAYQVGRE